MEVIGCERCVLAKIDEQNMIWLCKLEEEDRLNSTLSMVRAIDQQMQVGVPLTAVVQNALKEVNLAIKRYMDELHGMSEQSSELIRERVTEIVHLHSAHVVDSVKLLLEQNKSVGEIEHDLKQLTSNLSALLAKFQLPTIKGEQKELELSKILHDAFFANANIEVQPLGGADATDFLLKLKHDSVVIGSVLVESKSNGKWSNDYAQQVENDLERYHTSMAILCVDTLPRAARGRGFTVNNGRGIVVTTSIELVVPTITIYYDIHAQYYAIKKKAIDLEELTADRDISYYLNETLQALDECKKINDAIDDTKQKIHACTERLSERIQRNNRKIAEVLARYSHAPECKDRSTMQENL